MTLKNEDQTNIRNSSYYVPNNNIVLKCSRKELVGFFFNGPSLSIAQNRQTWLTCLVRCMYAQFSREEKVLTFCSQAAR